VANFTAERLKCDIIIDAFCGVGGNSIQFAKTCERGKDKNTVYDEQRIIFSIFSYLN
jgi:RNA cap guanine-N2 methyltransferase